MNEGKRIREEHTAELPRAEVGVAGESEREREVP